MAKVDSEQIKSIIFELNNEEYAMPVNYVGSIERMMNITRVPGTPEFVKGVLNLRGIITPLIDLRLRFGIEEAEYTDRTRVIIVEHNDMTVGIIVDSANDVLDIAEGSIEDPPETVDSESNDYIEGVANDQGRLFTLLNIDKLISNEMIKKETLNQDEKLV